MWVSFWHAIVCVCLFELVDVGLIFGHTQAFETKPTQHNPLAKPSFSHPTWLPQPTLLDPLGPAWSLDFSPRYVAYLGINLQLEPELSWVARVSWHRFRATELPPVGHPDKVVKSEGILSKMAETFRLRIYNTKLPRYGGPYWILDVMLTLEEFPWIGSPPPMFFYGNHPLIAYVIYESWVIYVLLWLYESSGKDFNKTSLWKRMEKGFNG